MKLLKAKKVLLILAGIFGILASLGMLVAGLSYSFLGFAYSIGFIAYGIAMITQISSGNSIVINDQVLEGDQGVAMMIGIVAFAVILISIVFFFLSGPGYLGFIFLLVGSILAFTASGKKKKGTHIASIIFSSLSIIPALSYFMMAWIYTMLFVVVLLLLITPVGWLGLGLIVGFWGTGLAFILSILGNIFGLVGIKKEKQLQEQQVEIQEVK